MFQTCQETAARWFRPEDRLVDLKKTCTNKFKVLMDLDSSFFIHKYWLDNFAEAEIEKAFSTDFLSCLPDKETHKSLPTVRKIPIDCSYSHFGAQCSTMLLSWHGLDLSPRYKLFMAEASGLCRKTFL